MDTKTMLYVLNTRLKAIDNNPTKRYLLTEVIRALQKLDEYEKKDLTHQVENKNCKENSIGT